MLIDCAVVGAGPAGLATSAALSARGVEHVVLERGRVGESWRTQRWESFRLNTPGWMNQLLGEQARDTYATGVEVVQRLEKLAANCPIREGVPVARLAPAGDRFVLPTGGGDVLARTVVVATGDQNLPKVPALAGTFPDRVAHYHTVDYRGPDQLPEGAVLVVGSAQSGCQIAENLRAGGRRVVLATSPVGRVPFRHRGRETIEWLAEAARRYGVTSATVGNWRDRFVDAGKAGMDRSLPGPDGGQSQTERRLRHECEQLKLALAEATVQLRIWQKGAGVRR